MNKIIKKCFIEGYTSHLSDDRIISSEISNRETYTTNTVGLLVETTKDFCLDGENCELVREMDSYQIRPKALYKNEKGVYFKDNKKMRYLTMDELTEFDIEKYL